MSKEVKRYTANVFIPGNLGPVQREVVMEDDYEALLAERDALAVKYEAATTLALKFFELAAQLDPVGAKNFADQLERDLQGAQP